MNAPAPGLVARVDRRLDRWITGWNPYDPAKLGDKGVEPVVITESEVRKKGARWFAVAFVAFMAWATTMPIDSGVPVSGNVVVAGYRKAVQHPTGGVVQRIFVREGDRVAAGQVLIKVNPLDSDANVTNYELQYLDLLVNESRLRAERLGQADIEWSPELATFGADARVGEAKAVQRQLFAARRAEYQSQINGFEAQIGGLASVIASHQVQLQTINEELRNNEELAKEGYVPRSQVNSSLRTRAEQEAALANARSEIAKIRSQIAQARTAYLKDVETQLSDIQRNRDAYSSRLSAARFDQQLTEIRAPVAGTVVGLKVFTVGGVIQAGQTLAEVVPQDGALLVETRIPPSLIDKVRVGLAADTRFLAFNQSTTPVIEGRVKLVGVDLLTAEDARDPNAPPQYYLAQVEVTPQGLRDLASLQVQPGMPVDVIIKTGERTFMSYLLKPLTDKLARAFKD
jgi:protease secretion system membrane fusion protein